MDKDQSFLIDVSLIIGKIIPYPPTDIAAPNKAWKNMTKKNQGAVDLWTRSCHLKMWKKKQGNKQLFHLFENLGILVGKMFFEVLGLPTSLTFEEF